MMRKTQKAINYLRQRGIDLEKARDFYKPFTRDALHKMVKEDLPDVKVTSRTTKAELIDYMVINCYGSVLTARQKRRLSITPA